MKMVKNEFGDDIGSSNNLEVKNIVYERGKFYEEYSARRNERLRRKNGVSGTEKKAPYSLGVNVEPVKKRDPKKLASLRKSVPPNFVVNLTPSTRYSLRSSTKENKKPPLAPVPVNLERSVAYSERKTGTRKPTSRRI